MEPWSGGYGEETDNQDVVSSYPDHFAAKMNRLKRLKINAKEDRDEPFFRNVI